MSSDMHSLMSVKSPWGIKYTGGTDFDTDLDPNSVQSTKSVRSVVQTDAESTSSSPSSASSSSSPSPSSSSSSSSSSPSSSSSTFSLAALVASSQSDDAGLYMRHI